MRPTIHVVATTADGTRAALGAAVSMAKGSDGKLVLLVPRIVSYAGPSSAADGSTAWFVEQYRRTLHDLNAAADTEVFVCRTPGEIVAQLVAFRSIVVVGGPAGRWLTSPEQRFVNQLTRAGCQAVFVASGTNTTQRRVAPAVAA
ncbi:MAG: hypothetical protein ACM3SQ_14255 [Betaproteobacteria bacterium]